MKKHFDGHLSASHGQFWIYDAAIEDGFVDLLESILENGIDHLSKVGYLQRDSFLAIATHTDFGTHWLQIYLSEEAPSFSDQHDFEISVRFAMQSDQINIRSPTAAEPQTRYNIPRGDYRLFVFGYHQGVDGGEAEDDRFRKGMPPSNHDFEGYRLIFVP